MPEPIDVVSSLRSGITPRHELLQHESPLHYLIIQRWAQWGTSPGNQSSGEIIITTSRHVMIPALLNAYFYL